MVTQEFNEFSSFNEHVDTIKCLRPSKEQSQAMNVIKTNSPDSERQFKAFRVIT